MISIENLHHDYLLITQMKIPIKRKVRLLTELFGETENPWRVVGITESALKVFIQNNFNRVPRMGINRAHIINRVKTHTYLIENVYNDADAWWNYYYENDKTILSTSSENMSNTFSRIYDIDEKENYFKSVGFSWSYRKSKEKPFLEQLAKDNGLA